MKYKEFKKTTKTHPEIELITGKYLKEILSDFKDIELVAKVFGEFHNMNFPEALHSLGPRTASQVEIKFTALCLYCFDPETIKGPYYKKMRNYMRSTIADFIKTNPSQISQYIPKARVYMRAYPHFRNDMALLVAIVKMRHEQRADKIN